MDERKNELGTIPIRRLILTMFWPMMLSMLIQALYNMVDSYYVLCQRISGPLPGLSRPDPDDLCLHPRS